MKEKLPNATASLVLGILSIVFCWCYAVPGIIMGIIGLILGNKAVRLHNENPEQYDGVGNAKTGKITAMIGLILTVLFSAYLFWMLSKIGWDALSDPELLQERIQELQN